MTAPWAWAGGDAGWRLPVPRAWARPGGLPGVGGPATHVSCGGVWPPPAGSSLARRCRRGVREHVSQQSRGPPHRPREPAGLRRAGRGAGRNSGVPPPGEPSRQWSDGRTGPAGAQGWVRTPHPGTLRPGWEGQPWTSGCGHPFTGSSRESRAGAAGAPGPGRWWPCTVPRAPS